jgi:hypothetical protein
MIDGQMARRIKQVLDAIIKTVQRSRRGRAALSGIRATAGVFGRILHQLWLEVTGFTFLALAAVGAMAGMREYGKYQAGHSSGPGRLMLAICFTASFTWFGLSSFWRVNRKKAKAKS